jgi:hypothetical protein
VDGATGVPRNAVVYVAAALVNGGGVTLVRLPDETPVQLAVETSAMRWIVERPAMLLDAGTSYRVTVAGAQGTAGTVTTTFTTGDATDASAPSFAGLTGVVAEIMSYPILTGTGTCHSSCVETGGTNHISRLRLDHPPLPSDAAYAIFEIYAEPAHVLLDSVPLAAIYGDVLGSFSCSASAPVLAIDGQYCARVVAYDAAGNAAGADVMACTATTACRPMQDALCNPVDTCSPIEASAGSGCAAAPGGGLLLLGLLALARRRR